MLQEKSCGAVVYLKHKNQTKYLLLHYSAKHWDFVKGHVEANETEKQTVIRELKEETGIADAHFKEGFRETIAYFYRKDKVNMHKKVVFYLIETHSEEVTISSEHIGYAWLGYENATEKLSFSNGKAVLRKACEFIEKL